MTERRKGGRGTRSPLQVVCSIDDDVHAWPGAAEVGYNRSVKHALMRITVPMMRITVRNDASPQRLRLRHSIERLPPACSGVGAQ